MFYHCKNKSRELEMCGWEYFRIRIYIIASQQIPGLSRTFHLNFQDFPGPKSFSRPGNFTLKIPGLSRMRGTLVYSEQRHLTVRYYMFHTHSFIKRYQ